MNFSIIARYLYHTIQRFSNKKIDESTIKDQSSMINSNETVSSHPLSQEILDEIEHLVLLSVRNKKEETQLKKLVSENEDCARELYGKLPQSQTTIISNILYAHQKGSDLAEQEANLFVEQQEAIDTTEERALILRKWLTCETNVFPNEFPIDRCIAPLDKKSNVELCWMSKVHPLPERLWIYGAKMGYVDIAREPVKEMIREIGIEYAQSFLQRIEQNYPIKKEEYMKIIALIYIAPHKLKKEVTFYGEIIQNWLNTDHDLFWNAISELDQEKQKRIKKALESLITS